MAEPVIQDPAAKKVELDALVGREATITSVRHGDVQTFEGTLTEVDAFSHVRFNSDTRTHSQGEPVQEGGGERTLNFLHSRSGIRSMTVGGEEVYSNPHLPDTYGTETEPYLTYREQMFGDYDRESRAKVIRLL